MTLRSESSIASEFRLVGWQNVLNSFKCVSRITLGSELISLDLVLTVMGLYGGFMTRQRVDCPYFLRLAVTASRFNLRHRLVLLFFNLDFSLGSRSLVILSFRSLNSLFFTNSLGY